MQQENKKNPDEFSGIRKPTYLTHMYILISTFHDKILVSLDYKEISIFHTQPNQIMTDSYPAKF